MPTARSDECAALGFEPRLWHWCRTWGVESLASEIRIELSTRMTRSLGRAYPERNLIRVAAVLESGPPDFLEEVLCHEAAHLAVYSLHGRTVRPHGAEWKALMRTAGYEPTVRLRVPRGVPRPRRRRRKRPRRLYDHRCPVCNASRVARRRMTRWHCVHCVDAGRSGRLEIKELSKLLRFLV